MENMPGSKPRFRTFSRALFPELANSVFVRTNPSLVVTVRTDRINTCVIEVIEDLEGFAGLGVDIAPLGGNVPRVGEDQRCDKTE